MPSDDAADAEDEAADDDDDDCNEDDILSDPMCFASFLSLYVNITRGASRAGRGGASGASAAGAERRRSTSAGSSPFSSSPSPLTTIRAGADFRFATDRFAAHAGFFFANLACLTNASLSFKDRGAFDSPRSSGTLSSTWETARATRVSNQTRTGQKNRAESCAPGRSIDLRYRRRMSAPDPVFGFVLGAIRRHRSRLRLAARTPDGTKGESEHRIWRAHEPLAPQIDGSTGCTAFSAVLLTSFSAEARPLSVRRLLALTDPPSSQGPNPAETGLRGRTIGLAWTNGTPGATHLI